MSDMGRKGNNDNTCRKKKKRERERERGKGRAYRTADFPWATLPVELRAELFSHLLSFF